MRIERDIINQFKAWKEAPDRKPRHRMRYSMLNLQYNCGLLSSPAPLAGWIDKWMEMIRCTEHT
ncbi:MAG: hypothetical protein K6G92_06810 [Bacteroidaceae bacterium]|nr:hypothetical protein [Bacteroidaceae bacterium]